MDIREQIIEQLNQFAAKGPQHVETGGQGSPEPGYLVGVLSETDEGVGASLDLADYDRFSVALRHLEVFHKQLDVEVDEAKTFLQKNAETLVAKLTYLEEPLELLELDPTEGVALMRSNPPLTKSDESEVTYWEILLRTSPHPNVNLTRYQWTANVGDRTVAAYPATFTMLGRIAEDLVAGLNQNISDED
ncbi:MAG: hypothetical protein H6631_19130 [Anaerolineaceae bacterium]|nr:hypothetical protein [Anaerolineaceae bacterium]